MTLRVDESGVNGKEGTNGGILSPHEEEVQDEEEGEEED